MSWLINWPMNWPANWIVGIFLVLFAAKWLVENGLLWLNLAYVRRAGASVPPRALAGRIEPEAAAKSARYTSNASPILQKTLASIIGLTLCDAITEPGPPAYAGVNVARPTDISEVTAISAKVICIFFIVIAFTKAKPLYMSIILY